KQRGLLLLSLLTSLGLLIVPTTARAFFDLGSYTLGILAWLITIVPCVIFNYIAYWGARVVIIITDTYTQEIINNVNGKWSITRTPIFLSGWVTTRNFANMLIVLAIIGIAVATILRFKEYEAKKLLLPIVVMALLINFSNVFCGI